MGQSTRRTPSDLPPAAALIAQSLDAVVGLVKLTARLAADRDRYHDALEAITVCGDLASVRLARQALEAGR